MSILLLLFFFFLSKSVLSRLEVVHRYIIKDILPVCAPALRITLLLGFSLAVRKSLLFSCLIYYPHKKPSILILPLHRLQHSLPGWAVSEQINVVVSVD